MSLSANNRGDTLSPRAVYKLGGTLMSPRYNSPTKRDVSAAKSPAFGKANVKVAVAATVGSNALPVAVSIPDGVSSERTGFVGKLYQFGCAPGWRSLQAVADDSVDDQFRHTN